MKRAEYKTCYVCKKQLPDEAFRAITVYRCKECTAAYNKEYRKKNLAVRQAAEKNYHTTKLYGVSVDEYNTLVTQPCEICGQSKGQGVGKMCLDHTEKGSYHGVLCHACNAALGLLKHDSVLFRQAISYLERTRK